ncbi:MAG TPA: hypothetical protein VHV55_02710 [Pirellulales bacterium]|jgi:hypothetical protein|nr:hypothetical protein [Pirellulales bacterium]
MNQPTGDAVQCLNCMAKDARRQKISGWQWIVAPLAVPVMCNRCLTSYYYPRLLILFERFHSRVTHQ